MEQEGYSEGDSIWEVVEYVMKFKFFFGGFVLVVWYNQQIVGVIIVNCIGMEVYNFKNIFVFVIVEDSYCRKEVFVKQLIDQGIKYVDGDIVMYVKFDNLALAIYQKFGFKVQYLEFCFFNFKFFLVVAF